MVIKEDKVMLFGVGGNPDVITVSAIEEKGKLTNILASNIGSRMEETRIFLGDKNKITVWQKYNTIDNDNSMSIIF